MTYFNIWCNGNAVWSFSHYAPSSNEQAQFVATGTATASIIFYILGFNKVGRVFKNANVKKLQGLHFGIKYCDRQDI